MPTKKSAPKKRVRAALKKGQQVPSPKASKTYQVLCKAGASEDEQRRGAADLISSPAMAACRVIDAAERNTGYNDILDVPSLVAGLKAQAERVQGGSLADQEAMLTNQATALQSLFARLAEKALSAEYMANFDIYMRMALRAQSQSRATIETLAAIKNPPVLFAKQANFANGPQQVNNGTPARAELESAPNKLLEVTRGQWMDTGTKVEAGGAHPHLAAVGTIDGPAN